MNFKSFFFLHFFSLFSFPRIFIQIFQEPNIGALLIEMLYLLLVLALFGSSLSQFSKFFLWICNLNWPWSFKYHLLPIHSPPASCLKKKKKKRFLALLLMNWSYTIIQQKLNRRIFPNGSNTVNGEKGSPLN